MNYCLQIDDMNPEWDEPVVIEAGSDDEAIEKARAHVMKLGKPTGFNPGIDAILWGENYGDREVTAMHFVYVDGKLVEK